MTGGLAIDGQEALDRLLYGPGVFGEQWVRARIFFEDGGFLLFHDPRRFGSLELAPDESKLGPDALSVTRAELAAALWVPTGRATPPAPLKARLMDQDRLAGIGNLLADEILWRAGLDPQRRDALSDEELRHLHKTLRATLRELGREGGSHMGDLQGRAPHRRALPARRHRALGGHGRRADHLLVPKHQH